VNVEVDESGKESRAVQVDYGIGCRQLRCFRIKDSYDVTGFDQHSAWFDQAVVTDDSRAAQ
jgi:hypothetical protein